MRLGARAPVQAVILDRFDLGQRPVHVERIERIAGHPVGHQRRLKRAVGPFVERAHAREFLNIEEIRPVLRRVIAIGFGVIDKGVAVKDDGNTMLKRIARQGLVL